MEKSDKSKQVYKEITGMVRLNREIIELLKVKSATEKTTIKALLEGAAADLLEVKCTN